ncbi:hypothetical protein L7F22_044554 [Adiantum nelumboides]|nr:hypothetical protein [Adiantum nelumboides]
MTSTALVEDVLPATIQNVLDQKTLKWIFCGGKGRCRQDDDVVLLGRANVQGARERFADQYGSAHNLSDAFGQKFGKEATKVNGFDNLSAMEIDPTSSIQEMIEQCEWRASIGLRWFAHTCSLCHCPADAQRGWWRHVIDDAGLAFAIPGVDEAMGFAEIMKHVKSMQYSVIIFDTAPTGHTLRFLSFPTVLEKALAKFSTLGRSFGPMLNQVCGAVDVAGVTCTNPLLPTQMTSMMGAGQGNQEDMFAKLESMRAVINEVNTQFKDPDKTTFVCVCIAEFLSSTRRSG